MGAGYRTVAPPEQKFWEQRWTDISYNIQDIFFIANGLDVQEEQSE